MVIRAMSPVAPPHRSLHAWRAASLWAVLLGGVTCGRAIGQRVDRFDAAETFQTIDHFAAHDSWTGQAYGAWAPARRELMADALFDREAGIGLSGWYFRLAAGTDTAIASQTYYFGH